jgi:hypothetical protein
MRTRSLELLCLLLTLGGGIVLLGCASADAAGRNLSKRWLFVWQDLSDPKAVDRVIARLPRAQAASYNACVLPAEIAPSKVEELKREAKRHGLDLIPIVMGGMVGADRNLAEGVPVKDALFVAKGGVATFAPDPPISLPGAGFDRAPANRFEGWEFQDDPGVTTFFDQQVKHGGSGSVRMERFGQGNPYGNCRLSRVIELQPFRQYAIKVWVKTQDFATPGSAEVKVLTTGEPTRALSFQTFGLRRTQDWTEEYVVFNSLDHHEARLYVGVWGGKGGRIWWDELSLEEMGLVNVLRRPGTPVSVRGEDGVAYQEGRDFEPIRDPQLHPWRPYHEMPVIRLTPNSRIPEGARLRVSYYHPVVIYEDRVDTCLSEPKVFELWREQIKKANDLLHPPAFFMSHDEIRVINWCQACQSRRMTPGQLLADNVRRAAQIIREIRPDAEIWVWNDMFDPLHNAVDDYYLCNGSLKGSWEGLDPGIGIVNWYGRLKGKNCRFFSDLGEKQVLAGYYDGDEDGSAIAEWLKGTEEIPGIVGAMYTTWADKYDAMEAWARKAWGPAG